MASKNIKGITIKIGGDTTELSKALKDVNGIVAKSNSELKSLNQALKLDPKNTELLSQKQEVLKNNIKATTERLNTLKEAQRQMGSYNSLTDEQKESYRALSVEISKSESALKGMNKELKSTSTINLDGLKEGLKKVGEVAADVAKKMLQVTAAVGGALASVIGLGVKSYASLEQNIGAINKLFGDSANDLIENSKRAYKEAGLSANQYMETATSFSASLIKGLNGDTKQAVELTDRAIKDMSDNANTFGTSMDEVMNVYKALSKEQYTTLDNLRLGYAGTKEGMKQLIADASTYTEEQKELGITVDASSMSFDNMVKAISVVQKHIGIAGTTMKEAEGTITGSVNQMKASFDNFLNGTGSPEQLSESIMNVLRNISTAIQKLAPNILQGIVNLISTLIPQIGTLLFENIPLLLDSISKMIDELLDLLINNTEGVQHAITELINKVVEFITDNLPKILEIALLLIETLAKGLIDSLPTIINSAMELLFSIIDTILDHLDEIIDLAVTLIETLAISLIDALPKLLQKVPEIIVKLVDKLTDPEMLGKIIKAALVLIVELARGLIIALPELLKMPKTIIENLVNKIKERVTSTDWGKIGSDIIKGICDGFGRIGSYISKKVNEVKDAITNKFKSIFGIHSPSTLMRDTIGLNITAGIGEGIEEGVPKALKEVDTAMKQLNAGIEASVNPTINPSMTYESNYQLMALAMKEALQDMTVELDDENVGKFVIKKVTEEVYS